MVPPLSRPASSGDPLIPISPELGGWISFSQDPVALKGDLAVPLEGPIARAHAPQRSGGGMAQGADPEPGQKPAIACRTSEYIFYIDGTYEPVPTEKPDTLSGYPANGSIATFTPDRKPQNERIFIPDVMRLYPPEETGTGRLKYHTRPDGTRVSYCGTIRPDEDGNVAACSNKPYSHQIIGLPNSCKRRGCPECSPDWSQKGARRVQQSVNGYILATVPEPVKEALCEALQGLSGTEAPDEWKQLDQIQDVLDLAYRYLSRHIVISPPREVVAAIVERTERDLEKKGIDLEKDHIRYRNEFHRIFMKKYRRKLDQIARIAGLHAYVDVDHNIRLKKDRDSDNADQTLDKNRYRNILITSRWRHRVVFSPHSHLMAWGYLPPVEEFYEQTGGWIYKNLGVVTSVAGLTDYLLSHAPDIQGMHGYRPCGDLKNYRVQGEIKIPLFRKCLECLEEGKAAKDAGMVLAKLQSVEYQRDEHRQNKLISWEFKGGLSQKPYRTTEIIPIYERKPQAKLKPGAATADPPPRIAPWLSEEEKETKLREWKLLKNERERIRKANLWMPYASWEKLHYDERQRFKWRKSFSQEEYAAAGPDWQVKMFEWC